MRESGALSLHSRTHARAHTHTARADETQTPTPAGTPLRARVHNRATTPRTVGRPRSNTKGRARAGKRMGAPSSDLWPCCSLQGQAMASKV